MTDELEIDLMIERLPALRDGVLEYVSQLDPDTALTVLFAAVSDIYVRIHKGDEAELVRTVLQNDAQVLVGMLLTRRQASTDEARQAGAAINHINGWLTSGWETIDVGRRFKAALRAYEILAAEMPDDAAIITSTVSLALSLLGIAYQTALGKEPGAELDDGGQPDLMAMVVMLLLLSRLAGPAEADGAVH